MFTSFLYQITDKAGFNFAINDLLSTLLDKSINLGLKIITVVIVYFIGIWLISLIKKVGVRIVSRRKIDETVASFIDSLLSTLLKVALAIIIIGILGVPATSLAAILAAAGLAIGLAMKDNLSNFAGGVMILMNKPFRIGNRIVAQGQDGVVKEIGILYTVLLTGDARMIYLPNGPLSTGTIINYSHSKNRRIDIAFNINSGNNIDELKSIITEVISLNTGVLKNPDPFIGVTTVNNSNFDVTIRVWVVNSNYGNVSVELNESIYTALNQKSIFVTPALNIKMAE